MTAQYNKPANHQEYRILIISLHESKHRQQSVIKQLDELSLSYEIKLFDRTKTIDIKEYDKKRRLRLYGYDMQPGEVGVFLSHRVLWKSIMQSNLPALILEDDFLITHKSIDKILSQIAKINNQYNIVRFQTCFENERHVLTSVVDLDLVSYSKSKQGGATAYFINPKSAEKLYQNTHRFYMPADDFIDSEWAHNVLIYGLYPPPITVSGITSEIGERQKPSMSSLRKIWREINRSTIVFKRIAFAIFKKRKIIRTQKNKI